MGEWIKNRYADKPFVDADVVSYMRAWIETRISVCKHVASSHILHGYV